jgi:hypothetical protein
MTNHRKTAVLLALGLGVGCGGATPAEKGPAGPVSEQQRIINISQADIGICFSKPPALPDRLNGDVIVGLLVAARPAVMECLVDPKNRGAEDETTVTVKATVGGGKLAYAISGKNTTSSTETCIRGALDKFTGSIADLQTKVASTQGNASGEAQYLHIVGAMPGVKLGVNEVSDVAGTIRLAHASLCDCYAGWKDAEPQTLKATVKVGASAAPAVTFAASQDPKAQEVAACLTPKISALPFKAKSSQLTVPYTFYFLNSAVETPFTQASPEVSFSQLEALRGQRSADSVIAIGGRTVAAEAYDALIKQYKAKPESVTLEQLQNGCNALLKADDGYIGSLEKQLEVEQKMLSLLTDLSAKDQSWSRAKDGAKSQVDATVKDIDGAKKNKVADADACPKTKYE